MMFRLRQYKVAPGKIDVFNAFFSELLPVQKRYGARLVGRWQAEDGKRIVALWAYDDLEQYEAIQANVRADPDSVKAQEYRRAELNPLFTETEEAFMVSTVPLNWTELTHLEPQS